MFRVASLGLVVAIVACGPSDAPSVVAPGSQDALMESGQKLRPYVRPKGMTLQIPHEMVKGTTILSPALSALLSLPTSTTSPIVSWPRMSPGFMAGMKP